LGLVKRLLDADLTGAVRLPGVGLMTKKVRNRLRPMMTWLGGAACVPSAWRIRLSTMTMRVKPVIINTTAGKKPSAVKNSRVWIGTE
jgi:hypothetical protein